MHSSRLAHLLVVVASILFVAQATWFQGIDFLAFARRQLGDDSTKDPSTDNPSTAPEATSAETTSASKQAQTSSRTTSSTTRAATTPVSTPTSSPDSSDKSATTPVTNPPATGEGRSSATPPPTPVLSTEVVVVTKTDSNGDQTLETSRTVVTSTPGLNSNNSGASSGMSAKTRNTVIGVVVGVGGAIVLGALALVAWRIRARRRQNEENDGLMDYNMNLAANSEKPERGSSTAAHPTPFQSTLENYHQPTHVNASSNF